MKTITFIIAAIFLSSVVVAQESTVTAGAGNPKKSKKEIRAEKLEASYRATKAMVDSMQFVMEADWLSNQMGNRIPVHSTINFIQVDSTEAVIQTGNNTSLGRNGLGGTTATGKIANYVVNRKDDKHSINIRFDVSTSIGFFNISMDIMANGSATATLSGNRPGKLIYYGKLVPLNSSYAFKGSSY